MKPRSPLSSFYKLFISVERLSVRANLNQKLCQELGLTMESSPLNRPGPGGAVKRLVRRPSRFNFWSTLAIKSEKHSFQNLKGPTQITSTGHCLRQAGHHCNTSVGGTVKAPRDQGITIPPWPFILPLSCLLIWYSCCAITVFLISSWSEFFLF